MNKQIIIFSLLAAVMLSLLAVPVFGDAGNLTGNDTQTAGTNTTVINTTFEQNTSIAEQNSTFPEQNSTSTGQVNGSELPAAMQGNQTGNGTQGNQSANQTNASVPISNESINIDELVMIMQVQLKDLKTQNMILNEEIKTLRRDNANLTERLAELERKPVTYDDIEDTVDELYIQFAYWTAWIWPILALFLFVRYRKPAQEAEEERLQEAVETITKNTQREWYSHQVRKQGIEGYAADETELAIFRALQIHTVADLVGMEDKDIIEAFKAKYEPTADIEEHFKNRIAEIKKGLKEVDGK